ncbi:MAG: hypothetical protein AMXMBFR4_03650 [Candidatus Hydrogenedentota bacterium]
MVGPVRVVGLVGFAVVWGRFVCLADAGPVSQAGGVYRGGSPLAGANVAFLFGRRSVETRSQADGSFRVDLPQAGPGQFAVWHSGYQGEMWLERELSGWANFPAAGELRFELGRGDSSIEGTVRVNGEERWRALVSVSVDRGDGAVERWRAHTDKQGRFRLDGLPAGAHVLSVEPSWRLLNTAATRPRQYREVEVTTTAGSTTVKDIGFESGEIIATISGLGRLERGQVLVVDGQFEGGTLSVRMAELLLSRSVATRSCDRDGSYSFINIPDGTYTVFFAAFSRDAGLQLRHIFGSLRLAYERVRIQGDDIVEVTLSLE